MQKRETGDGYAHQKLDRVSKRCRCHMGGMICGQYSLAFEANKHLCVRGSIQINIKKPVIVFVQYALCISVNMPTYLSNLYCPLYGMQT